MGSFSKRAWQGGLAALFAVAAMTFAVTPGQAVTWHTWQRWCGTFFTTVCDVQYTGGWPGGMVRGYGQRNLWEVILQTSADGGPWLDRATTFPESNGGNFITPAVAVGKLNEYRTCMVTIQGGRVNCDSPQGPIYLGD